MIRDPVAEDGLPTGTFRVFPALATGLLALCLLALPLPFGSVLPWAVALAEVLLFTAAALAFARRAFGATDGRAAWEGARPAAALAAIAALGWLQSLPLPGLVLARLSPGHAALAARAEEAAGAPAVHALSVAPGVSRGVALWWLAVAAAFAAAAFVARERRHRRWLAAALVGAALFQGVYAIQAWLLGVETIWGIAVPPQPGRLRGTFVNPAHMGALLAVALAVTFAGIGVAARRAREEPAFERRLLWVAPPVALWVLLFATLTFTASRAALLGALVTAGVQGWWVARSGRSGRARALASPRFAAVLLVALGLAVAAWIAYERGLVRLTRISPLEISVTARLEAWRACLELWQRFPILGTGLGTFREAFPMVQPSALGGEWWHAHGDPLELLVTAGLAGAGIAILGLALLLRRLLAVLAGGYRTEDRAAALAALGALAGLALHENLDFPLTMPAVAVAVAVLCGAACGVPLSRPAQGTEGEQLAERPPRG